MRIAVVVAVVAMVSALIGGSAFETVVGVGFFGSAGHCVVGIGCNELESELDFKLPLGLLMLSNED